MVELAAEYFNERVNPAHHFHQHCSTGKEVVNFVNLNLDLYARLTQILCPYIPDNFVTNKMCVRVTML